MKSKKSVSPIYGFSPRRDIATKVRVERASLNLLCLIEKDVRERAEAWKETRARAKDKHGIS